MVFTSQRGPVVSIANGAGSESLDAEPCLSDESVDRVLNTYPNKPGFGILQETCFGCSRAESANCSSSDRHKRFGGTAETAISSSTRITRPTLTNYTTTSTETFAMGGNMLSIALSLVYYTPSWSASKATFVLCHQ